MKLPKRILHSPGFTLVELMVVITIIAILTVVGMAVYSTVQRNARDARRKQDIDAIANAMETNFGKDTPGLYSGLTTSNFAGGNVPVDPINQASPSSCGGSNACQYCFVQGASSFTGSFTCIGTGSAVLNPVSGAILGPTGGASNPNWMICANLEGSSTAYCRTNQQ